MGSTSRSTFPGKPVFAYCSWLWIIPSSVDIEAGVCAVASGMRVVLEGLPERVQETADALDHAFPGLLTWHQWAEPGRDHIIRLEGVKSLCEAVGPRWHRSRTAQLTSQKWRINPAIQEPGRADGRGDPARSKPMRGSFCASILRSLPPSTSRRPSPPISPHAPAASGQLGPETFLEQPAEVPAQAVTSWSASLDFPMKT